MCRFALIKTFVPVQPQVLLKDFSDMAAASRSPDGDTQGDGWGLGWRQNGKWQKYVSLSPIWEQKHVFDKFPNSRVFLIHARSASFDRDKNNLEYNQPYTNEELAFVFNGLLKRMKYPRPLPGDIGAQKIWHLLQEFAGKYETGAGIEMTISKLNKYSAQVRALNLGVSDGQKLYAYCQFSGNRDYYTLRVHQSSRLTIISSEPFGDHAFGPLQPKTVYEF